MIKIKYLILAISFFFLQARSLEAQSFLKSLNNENLNYNQRISQFSNGDLLIGDSSIEALRSGSEEGIIFLTRIDNCGRPLWSYEYKLKEGYLEFKDFVVNEQDEIFVYGSFYKGLSEFLFLFKVDGLSGVNEDFYLWNTGTVDHFSYSMDFRNGHLMLYGLILGFQTQKQGFIALFDNKLNFEKGFQFSPLEAGGTAIMTRDNAYLARSDKYILKIDNQGKLLWARAFDQRFNVLIHGGPVEVGDGYILEAKMDDEAFFFKISNSGQLLWMSELFKAAPIAGAISILEDNSILSTYSKSSNEHRALCQMQLSNEGQILKQTELLLDQSMSPGNIYQSINQQQMRIAVNDDPFLTGPSDLKDFILQFPLKNAVENCFFWEPFTEHFTNPLPQSLNQVDLEVNPYELRLEQVIEFDAIPYELPMVDQCVLDVNLNNYQRDTLLPCGIDNWKVQLPGEDFFWTDGSLDNPRLLEEPGLYKARNRDCVNPIIAEFELNKEDCPCQVYLPTAFSPNGDGINDQLSLFSDCNLEKIEMTVYNRWGSKVFQKQGQDISWNGRSQNVDLSNGIYMVRVKYEWRDQEGELKQDAVYQELTLIR